MVADPLTTEEGAGGVADTEPGSDETVIAFVLAPKMQSGGTEKPSPWEVTGAAVEAVGLHMVSPNRMTSEVVMGQSASDVLGATAAAVEGVGLEESVVSIAKRSEAALEPDTKAKVGASMTANAVDSSPALVEPWEVIARSCTSAVVGRVKVKIALGSDKSMSSHTVWPEVAVDPCTSAVVGAVKVEIASGFIKSAVSCLTQSEVAVNPQKPAA